MLRSIPGLGPLHALKVFPLACLSGLCDVRKCFNNCLYGVVPQDKPHAQELAELGCKTVENQQKFIEGLNEWLGVPRQFFFHGDHVLCFTEGVLDGTKIHKREIFFPEQTLYCLVDDKNSGTVCVVQKKYGEKDWSPCLPISVFEE